MRLFNPANPAYDAPIFVSEEALQIFKRYSAIMRAKLHFLEGVAEGLSSQVLRGAVEDMRRLLNEMDRFE